MCVCTSTALYVFMAYIISSNFRCQIHSGEGRPFYSRFPFQILLTELAITLHSESIHIALHFTSGSSLLISLEVVFTHVNERPSLSDALTCEPTKLLCTFGQLVVCFHSLCRLCSFSFDSVSARLITPDSARYIRKCSFLPRSGFQKTRKQKYRICKKHEEVLKPYVPRYYKTGKGTLSLLHRVRSQKMLRVIKHKRCYNFFASAVSGTKVFIYYILHLEPDRQHSCSTVGSNHQAFLFSYQQTDSKQLSPVGKVW